MSQELRHKSNRDALVAYFDTLIRRLERMLKEAKANRDMVLKELDQGIAGLELQAKVLDGTGRRRPVPASVHQQIRSALAHLKQRREAIAKIPVTKMEREAALVRERKSAKRQEKKAA